MIERDNIKGYRTFKELLDSDIVEMFEYTGHYYIRVKPESFYDESVWKVDKETEKISCIHFVETFLIPDKERISINPKKIRMLRNKKK